MNFVSMNNTIHRLEPSGRASWEERIDDAAVAVANSD
jgi:hypothetical protein